MKNQVWFAYLCAVALGLFVIVKEGVGEAIPVQVPPFQPLLLAFDIKRDRLYAAMPSGGEAGSRIVVFSQPGSGDGKPGPSLDFPGVASGLAYDSESETLFVSNATRKELMIFDRFTAAPSTRPSRVLRKFNFPTGIYPDPSNKRLFVADSHPGALLVFDNLHGVEGERKPDRTIGRESGLNGPFAIAADPEKGRIYVSNFDGVFVFDAGDFSKPPERLPLPPKAMARGLSFDPVLRKLYIATPMLRSFFVYDGAQLQQVELQETSGIFPFSLVLDPKSDRLYLSGSQPEIAVIEQAGGRSNPPSSTEKIERKVDRWLRWGDFSPEAPSPHPKPEPPKGLPSPHLPDRAVPPAGAV